jgi:hypothetical protein
MPGRVTEGAGTGVRGGPRPGVSVVWQVVAVVVLFAFAGAVAGWVWDRVWDPPSGVAFEGSWYLDSTGRRAQFTSTGWFVVVGAVTGLVLGSLCAWLFERSELATLLAVLLGAALATYLMYAVGLALSPEDPRDLARDAADGTRIPARADVSGRSPFLILPVASLAALAVAYGGFPNRRHGRG